MYIGSGNIFTHWLHANGDFGLSKRRSLLLLLLLMLLLMLLRNLVMLSQPEK
jgi:hypothetical protein